MFLIQFQVQIIALFDFNVNIKYITIIYYKYDKNNLDCKVGVVYFLNIKNNILGTDLLSPKGYHRRLSA